MTTEEENKIKEVVRKVLPQFLQGEAFTDKKITDTPTDSLAVVNRGYVNLSGTISARPNSSVAVMGQRYFPTDTSIPMVYNRNSSVWVNGVGSVVAQG